MEREGLEGRGDWKNIRSCIAKLVESFEKWEKLPINAEELQKWKADGLQRCHRTSFGVMLSEKKFLEAANILAAMPQSPQKTERLQLLAKKADDFLKDIQVSFHLTGTNKSQWKIQEEAIRKEMEDLNVTYQKLFE